MRTALFMLAIAGYIFAGCMPVHAQVQDDPPTPESPELPTQTEDGKPITSAGPPVSTPSAEKHSNDDVCTEHSAGAQWIDHLETKLYRLTCASASWFDGLFGNRHFDEDYRATHGSATVGALWSQRNSFEKLLRFHARLYLPQAQERLHAFIGRVDREEYVTEAQPQSQLYGLPRVFSRNLEDSTLLGLGYNEPLTKRGSFDADAGVRLDIPLDPFVKASYRLARPIGDKNIIRFRETIFWENSEGFGTTLTTDLDHVVADAMFLRTTVSGTYSQISEGLRWYSNATLYHIVGDNRALAYDLSVSGATDRAVPLADYGFTVIYRQPVWREWLLIEVRAGMDWWRDAVEEPRRSSLNAGIAFELRFGRVEPNVLQHL